MTDQSASIYTKTPITVAHGDGIGPEIMAATLAILDAAGAQLDIETIEIGEKLYKHGHSSGIDSSAWESLRRTKVFLKAPITTPQGGGVKSLNVTIRKTLGLYANIRPCRAYAPFIPTNHPDMDLIVIRENEEDLYAGIEHRQTDEVVQCLKLITRPGSEKIIRYAFEYARSRGRKRITCMVKDNIMKLTDGLFHDVFKEIAAEYPDIEHDHLIIDIGMARAADTPDMFDVIVLPNLYGDILSDVTAQITGSVGIAGSANIGEHVAMFEAIHGSAPTIAGQNIANPSGLLLGSVKMLAHINQVEIAERVHNAWLRTIEDGIHTADIVSAKSRQQVGTQEFAAAVIHRLGKKPKVLQPAVYHHHNMDMISYKRKPAAKKELLGVDVFIDSREHVDKVAAGLNAAAEEGALNLIMITNRGVKVWPNGFPETFWTDHWRCRFESPTGDIVTHHDIVSLLGRIDGEGLDFIKTEHLYQFDGVRGYSLGQGQ